MKCVHVYRATGLGIKGGFLCSGAATVGAATDSARTSFVGEVVAHLAQVLKDSGFSAALRNANSGNATAEEGMNERQREREEQLRVATRRLIVAGLLASACLTGHLAHIWPGRHTHMRIAQQACFP